MIYISVENYNTFKDKVISENTYLKNSSVQIRKWRNDKQKQKCLNNITSTFEKRNLRF